MPAQDAVATNIYEALHTTEKLHGTNEAIRYIEDVYQTEASLSWTYSNFLNHIRSAANLFRACGVGEKASVALMGPNIPFSQVALFAGEVAGYTLPINPFLPPEHIIGLLTAAKSCVLVFAGDPALADKLKAAVPSLQHVFLLGGGPGSFEAALSEHRTDALDFPVRSDPDAVIATFHTGGTTGTPKLVQQTQANQLAAVRSVAARGVFNKDDVGLNAMPLFHVAGALCIALTALTVGACQLLCTVAGARHPDFIPGYWKILENHKVTLAGGVPTTMGALAATIPESRPPTLEKIITGGAALPLSIEATFKTKLGIAPYIIYGMTETAAFLTIKSPEDDLPLGWCGAPSGDLDIRIVANPQDIENTCVPIGMNGHVVARGKVISPGYTDETYNTGAFTEDGWFITGDLGMMDEGGNLLLTGRAKDLIIRGGHNIDPAVIENAALKHPDIEAAAAVGAPDAYAGELPVLYVQMRSGAAELNADALLEILRAEIEKPAMPKWIECVEALPVTAVGKVYKPTLVAKAASRALGALLKAAHIDPATVTVKDKNGIPAVIFVADSNSHSTIKKLMDPLLLAYSINTP